ncbi:MAG: sigma-54-dependent Fis family transcriptional regulator [Planctomycetota bacterium]|jgi:Nif-specific regulatory protein
MATRSTLGTTVFQRLGDDPPVASLAAEVLWRANIADTRAGYLADALPVMASSAGGSYAAVAAPAGGQWTAVVESGASQPLPASLLAEVLDRETAGSQQEWIAAPLALHGTKAEALVLRCAAGTDPSRALATIERLAPFLNEGLNAVADRRRTLRRVRRLEAVLQITGEWNQTREVGPLLVKMAEAATQLLEADRASIFVWDRHTHTLVGRPALGVEGGELRVPDDRGVVGRVIQSGEASRSDATTDPDLIDHSVDSKLGYQTRSVLCVPMQGRSGELFGAFEVINKLSGSFDPEDEVALVELAAHAAIALENAQDRERLVSANRQITEQAAQGAQLIGGAPSIEDLRTTVQRVADTDLAVLILGENGTGKEVVAQSIHYLSPRRDEPFVAVNCAAIPDTLAESELFGHEKGAFTDAQETRRGKFELAAEGTLFLDEIGDLSLNCQAKLLRVLEEKVLVRVGGAVPISTDARVIAATNQNLAEMVREKRFREDLYFRLNVVMLELPPLRERPGDVIVLARHFLEEFSRKARRRVPEFSAAARERLETHAWPGNVRELRNLMERIAYLSTGERIEADDLAFILSPHGGSPQPIDSGEPLAEATVAFQAEYIRRAVHRAGGNMTQAASQLGLHRSNLYRKMRQLKMPTAPPADG